MPDQNRHNHLDSVLFRRDQNRFGILSVKGDRISMAPVLVTQNTIRLLSESQWDATGMRVLLHALVTGALRGENCAKLTLSSEVGRLGIGFKQTETLPKP